MSRQIRRKDVDWKRASCFGLDTDMFYLTRTELLLEGLSYNSLRRICFDCPIMRECLQIGTSLERYGFWGGLAQEERAAIYDDRDGKVIMRLKRDLLDMRMPYRPLANIVLSVERQFNDSEYTGRRPHERPAKSRTTDTTVDGNLL